MRTKKNRYNFFTVLAVVIILTLGPLAYFRFIKPKLTQASWFDDGWHYRKAVGVTNGNGSDLSDFQVSINIGTSALIAGGKMKSDCSDIRITDTNGKLLPHWIEENNPGCNAVTDTKVWVKIPSIPSSGGTVYIYYGNPTAPDNQNGNDVFEFFDDFNDEAINTNKWTSYTNGGSVSETAGNLQMTGSSTWNVNGISSNNSIDRSSNSYSIFWRVKFSDIGPNTMIGYSSKVLNYQNGIQQYTSGGTSWYEWRLGVGTSFPSETYTTDTWYSIETKLKSNLGYTLYKDNTNFKDDTTLNSNNYNIVMQTYNSSKITYFDYVYQKKSATTNPTSSLGSEEISKTPIAYWSFDEGQGNIVHDSSSNQNNGTLGTGDSAPSWSTEDMCVTGKCLKFGSDNDIANIPDSQNLRFDSGSQNFTLCSWVKLNSLPTHSFVISKEEATDDGWRLYIRDDGTLRGSVDAIDVDSKSGAIPADNKWHFGCFVADRSGNGQMYVDGSSSGSPVALNNEAMSTSGIIKIGARPISPYYPFDGFIDEVKIYPYARSSSEVKADYNAGKSGASTSKGTSASLGSNPTDFLSNGLVGYWNFDIESGTTVPDLSGNNNIGTLGTGNSAPGWSTGMYGIGGSFDGNDDYISIPDNTSLKPSSTVTVSAWIKPKTSPTTTAYYIVDKRNSGDDGFHLNMDTDNTVYFAIDTGDKLSATSSTTISNEQWSHITGTYDGTNIKIYINGILSGTQTQNGTMNITAYPLMIGCDQSNNVCYNDGKTRWFNGLIDEVRIYNRALSPAEVADLYNWAPGPAAYYDFEDAGGQAVTDKSGNGNNGTLGTGNSAPTLATGKFGKALKFDGNDTLLTNNIATSQTTNVTMEGWIYWNGVNQKAGLFYNGNSGSNGFGLFINDGTCNNAGNKIGVVLGGLTCDALTSTYTPPVKQWVFLTLTRDSTTWRLYANGILQNSGTTSPNTPSGVVSVGSSTSGSSSFFTGSIDEVKIYNYARTQKQIVEDMNAGHPAVGSPVGSALAHWDFDEGYGSTINNKGNGGSVLNGTMGTGNSAPTWSNDGKFSKALSFDGNDFAYSSSNTIFNITSNGFTYSAWINGNNFSNQSYNMIMGRYLPYFCVRNTGKLFFSVIDGTQRTLTGNTVLNTGQWYHAVATYDSQGYMKLYLNGKLDKTGGPYGTLNNYNQRMSIGTWQNEGGSHFNGLIDEVKIYNYALTEDEVALDYNQGQSLMMGSLSSGTGNTAPSTAASQEYCIPGDTATCSPPVARWDFNEGVGSSAYDTSGNGNNGGWNGTGTHWVTGKVGKAGKFNGSDDYVNSGAFQFLSTFTLEAWIKAETDVSTYRTIIGKELTSTNRNYWLELDSTTGLLTLRFSVGNSGKTFTSTKALNDNLWHHVVATYDNSYVNIYVDGVSVMTPAAQTGAPDNPEANCILGYSPTGARNFNGLIDQVRIYNYARSPAQIAWDYNRGAPIAHWDFDECQGTIAHDSINGLNGTINIGASGVQNTTGTCAASNAAAAWYNGTSGKYNASLNFDGTDDQISLSLASMQKMVTFSWWAKISSWTNTSFVSTLDYTPAPYGFSTYMLNSTTFRFSCGSTASGRYVNITTPQLDLNTWYHFVASYDTENNRFYLYINGKDIGYADPSGWSIDGLSNKIIIGRWATDYPDYYFSGQIDDVRIYNYALTAEQVKTLYNANSAIYFGE